MMDVLVDVGASLLLATPLVGAYALFALGLVVIYRASRILNLAHGAMAMLPAYLAMQAEPAVGTYGAIAVAVVTGGLLGVVVERGVVRRLRSVSTTAQTVGTVAVLIVIVAAVARIWNTATLQGPSIFGNEAFVVAQARLSHNGLLLFAVAVVAAAAFFALFKLTSLGLAMRLAADNRMAAGLMGVNPEATTIAAWAIAGAFAGLGGVLLGGFQGLHPYVLSLQVLPAFVAALIGGMESPTGALVGSGVVGVAIGIVPVLPGIGGQLGAPQLILVLLAFGVMLARGERLQAADTSAEGL